nr:hypothetical protein [uncultured Psychroserpens sp.]
MKVKAYLLFCIFSLLFFSNISSQETDLISAYEDYAEMEREVVYLHLNKSTYIKGESIGLKAYVLDKARKRLSTETSNLYCTISDSENTIIKKKLIMVNNGIAINDFTIDSLFTSGEYKITAYTNWMKNFEEKNFFSQKIRIIDPEFEKEIKQLKTTTDIDAQFLPEGGHLVTNVETIVGTIVKDVYGFGIPNLECSVIDSKENEVTAFKLNQFGLGRFRITPQANESYKVKMKVDEKDYMFDINTPESQGLGLNVSKQKDKTFITVKTNSATLSDLQNKVYTIAIHNGNQLKEINFRFNEDLEIVKAISNTDLFSGINIITVFDSNNAPILERQIFNYDGLNFKTSEEAQVQKKGDSLLVSIPFKDIDAKMFNNFSVSVLPYETRAYNHHENISSSTLLQPYVRGYIENSNYYFKSITPRKQYELDNLLLTQGWSSYDWNTIFNNPPDYDYDFENGISFKANFANKNFEQLLIYPTRNSPIEIIDLKPEDMAFEKQGVFPISEEKIEIGAIDKKGKPIMPYISLEFSPMEIPEFSLITDYVTLRSREVRSSEMSNYKEFVTGWKKIEQLDEVKLSAKREYTRIEKIRNSTVGRVDFFDEKKKRKYRTFGNFLSSRGFVVLENKAGVSVVGSGANEESYEFKIVGDPVIYLDGFILSDHNILRDYSLNQIEYIEINKSGVGNGIRGGASGVIKIKTNPFAQFENLPQKEVHKSFDIPLKFDVSKRFYIPRYESYSSNFFKEYGIVDWFSNVSTDQVGTLNLQIFDNEITNLKLYIEGFSNDGTFISEVKDIIIH